MKINLLKLKPKTYVFIIALLSLLSIHLSLNPRPLYEGQVNSGGSGADDANTDDDVEDPPGNINYTTSQELNKVTFGSVVMQTQWLILLFAILFITNRIIKGIPPKNDMWEFKDQPVLVWFFAFLSFSAMIIVKVISNRETRVVKGGKEEEKATGWWQVMNILIYFVIVFMAYTFCVAYLCMKVRETGPLGLGDAEVGMGGGGLGGAPGINLAFFGIFLVILNSFTNLFLYLKTKTKSERDATARSIYEAQLTVLLLMILTISFLAIFVYQGHINTGDEWLSTTRGHVLKIVIFFIFLVIGSLMVNFGADSGLFGLK